MEINDLYSNDMLISNIATSIMFASIALSIIMVVCHIINLKKAKKNTYTYLKVLAISGILTLITLAVSIFSTNRNIDIEDFKSRVENYTGDKIISEISQNDLNEFVYGSKPLVIETEKTFTYYEDVITEDESTETTEEETNDNPTDSEVDENENFTEDNVVEETYERIGKTKIIKIKYILYNNCGYVEFYSEVYENYFQRNYF